MNREPETSKPEPAPIWVIESIGGVPTIDPKPEISLSEDGRVTGTTGINRLMGSYEADNDTVRISGAGTTMMAGSPEAMEQESRFLRAIEGWNGFLVRDDRLQFGPTDTGMVGRRSHVEQPIE